MHGVVALAKKDLRLLLRDRGHLFFAFLWPLLMALFFGFIFGGDSERGTIPVAVVDEDGTGGSKALVDRLRATDGLELTALPRGEAERLVRRGKQTALVVIPKGYGEAEERMFVASRRLELAIDPSRSAEAAMLEGILTGAAMASLQDQLTNPDLGRRTVDRALADLGAASGDDAAATRRFLGELRAFLDARPAPGATGGAAGWNPVSIEKHALAAERAGPRSAFEFTFPQGILWGVIGCALGFAVSLAEERTRGTLARLRTSPLSRTHVLLGKALACFAAILIVEVALFGLGRAVFGVRPSSLPLLAAAALSLAVCFVGIMMAVSVVARSERTVGSVGWTVMLPLSMLGGAMVPLFVMPAWMRTLGHVSPVKWGILALEGAIWRGFGPAEMALPCAVLLAFGAAGFAAGAWRFSRE